MAQPWLFRVEVQPGESIASFVSRSAAANAVQPSMFLRHLNVMRGRKDFDLAPSVDVLALERALTLDAETFKSGAITSLVGETLLCADSGKRVPWVIPASRPCVCLRCLQEPSDPYLRRDWRLSYRTQCFQHGTPLQDSCAQCLRPLVLQTAIGQRPSFLVRCSCSNRSSTATPMPPELGEWSQFERFLDDGPNQSPWRAFGCEFTYQFLAGVRALITFVSMPKSALRVRSYLEHQMGIARGSISSGSSGRRAFNLEPIQQRRLSLNAVATLLTDWPHGFLETMQRAKVSASHFAQIEQELPYWLKTVIANGLCAQRYSPNTKEVQAAKAAMRRSNEVVTRLGISRLLGTRDARVLDEFFTRHRRRHTPEEATAFFLAAIHGLGGVPSARSEREVTRRNILMLLISAMSSASIEELCKLPAQTALVNFSALPSELAQFGRRTAGEMHSDRAEGEPLFMSRFRTPLVGASIRLAASVLLERHAALGVWRSADSLRGVFAPLVDRQRAHALVADESPSCGQILCRGEFDCC